MTLYLYAVQDQDGRELLSSVIEPTKVSDVTAVLDSKGNVILYHEGREVDRRKGEDGKTYKLHRVPADDKLKAPVSHAVLPAGEPEE